MCPHRREWSRIGSVSAPRTTRSLGLLLIALVLLVAAVIPNVRTVPGIAQAAPVAGAPTVGDCVTDPIYPGWNDLGLQSATTVGTTVGTYNYPQVGMSHCQGTRYGEITALINNPTKPVVTTSNSGNSRSMNVTDSNMDICGPAGYRYVGIAMSGSQPAPLLAGWYPLLAISTAASTPSIRQQAAGQHWLACIVYLRTSTGLPGAADQERYDKSIRNALFTGQERDRTGLCVAAADLDEAEGGDIGCATDHHSEILGLSTTGTHPVARTDLESTCHQVVARLTNIAKITAAGLTVRMVATDNNRTPITTASIPAATSVTCGVSSDGPRALVGSLLALGSRPIPFK